VDDKKESVNHQPAVIGRSQLQAYVVFPVCLGAICGRSAAAQTLEVSPQRVLTDEPVVIRASGLQPNERVTIKADLFGWDRRAMGIVGGVCCRCTGRGGHLQPSAGHPPVSSAEVDLGGTPQGNAESSMDAIPKVLKFLRGSLVKCGKSTKS
jgi:hypothetical protein